MEDKSSLTGFLSVVEVANLGFCGGYLILNSHARPVEFHCSMPVTATRTQQILYGRTLRSYLFGETIGRALVEKAQDSPLVLLTDSLDAMSVESFSACPVAWVLSDQAISERSMTPEPLLAGARAHELHTCSVGPNVLHASPQTMPRIEAIVLPLAQEYSITEPFSRIHEAIREAHSATRLGENVLDSTPVPPVRSPAPEVIAY